MVCCEGGRASFLLTHGFHHLYEKRSPLLSLVRVGGLVLWIVPFVLVNFFIELFKFSVEFIVCYPE